MRKSRGERSCRIACVEVRIQQAASSYVISQSLIGDEHDFFSVAISAVIAFFHQDAFCDQPTVERFLEVLRRKQRIHDLRRSVQRQPTLPSIDRGG